MIHSLPNLKVILPAHGDLIENPKERIEEILNHREKRTRQVLKIIQNHSEMGISPSEIVQIIYKNENQMLKQMALGWICLTLKMLEKSNQIRRIEEDQVIKFFPSGKI